MTKPTTEIALVNRTGSSGAHAYITGLDLNQNNRPLFIQSDGKTLYHPSSPAKPQGPLEADCAIPLGQPGSTTRVTIPQIAGGRIWFVLDGTLKFLINPGPAIVEPSVTNPSDPNYHNFWGFCEFTYNQQQLFVNISYVDFVSLPIGLELRNEAGNTQSVGGLNPGGLDAICQGLVDQNNQDRVGWDKLVVKGRDGKNLRALSPNAGRVLNPGLFDNYYAPYVDAVWNKYADEDLTINTQAQWGDVRARVRDGQLDFGGSAGAFGRPTAADVFSCSTGPFATGSDVQRGAIGARLAAAFNRSTLLVNARQPEGESVAQYYRDPVTNHYARVVHAHNAGGRGYAFPYDDVGHAGQSGAGDQAGTVFDGAPALLTVTVGNDNNNNNSGSSSGGGSAVPAGQTRRAVEAEKPDEKQTPPQEGGKKKIGKVAGVVDKVKNVVKKLICK